MDTFVTSGQPQPQNSSILSQVLAHLGSENLELDSERLEAGAIAMAPVQKHLLDSVDALHT
jgi:hypothetical protein